MDWAVGIMESYRISRWTEPARGTAGLPVRKALVAMSVAWVARSWLEREAQLSPRQVDALLDSLEAQGVLRRSNRRPLFEQPAWGVGSTARGLLRRVSQNFVDTVFGRTSRRSVWPADFGHSATLPLVDCDATLR